MKHKKYHLNYFFSLLFFILALLSTTPAQTSYLDSLDGKFALQFQISENFTLTNFQGTTLSGKYHLGKRSAIRLGISINFRDSESDQQFTSKDTTGLDFKTTTDISGLEFLIKGQYVYYLVGTNEIGLFIGAGPSIGFGETDAKKQNPENSPYGDEITERQEYIIGLDAILGIEWFFSKNMTLSAEYGINFSYFHFEEKYESQIAKREGKNESIELKADYIRFGISIYF